MTTDIMTEETVTYWDGCSDYPTCFMLKGTEEAPIRADSRVYGAKNKYVKKTKP